ncbi:MAG: hypothetical protein CM1200mP38_6950 [Dehalococcoidia bacterium]|nr:MAG: hypothetical protein CM1200mP38_6950 [Dehalococcoidia bacterium]
MYTLQKDFLLLGNNCNDWIIVKNQMTDPFSLGVLTIGAASLTGIILAISWGSEVGFSQFLVLFLTNLEEN